MNIRAMVAATALAATALLAATAPTSGAEEDAATAAAPEVCGSMNHVQFRITGFTAHKTDDSFDADEVHIFTTTETSEGIKNVRVVPRHDADRGQTVVLPQDESVMFDGYLPAGASVKVFYVAYDLDTNYLDTVEGAFVAEILKAFVDAAADPVTAAITKYLAKLGYDFLRQPDKLAVAEISVPACGAAHETSSQYFKRRGCWLCHSSKYTFYYETDRAAL